MTNVSNVSLTLSASDRALLAGVGDADLASQGPLQIKVLQNNSPEVTAGADGYLGEHARPGMLAVPCNGEWVLIKGDVGLDFRLVAFTRVFLEWLPGRGGFVASHPEKPPGGVFLRQGERHPTWSREDVGVEKAGLYLSDGHRIEETILAHGLVDRIGLAAPIAGVLGFRSTALATGRDFADRAQRLKVENENIKGPILGRWKVTTRLEQRNDYRWYLPVLTLLGKLGEKAGPTLAEVVTAARLRQAFKDGMPWAPAEPPSPPPERIAHESAPSVPAQRQPARTDSITINGEKVDTSSRSAFARYEDADYGGPRSRDEIDNVDF